MDDILHSKIIKSHSQSEDPPLLILHGLFGMLDNWQSLGNRFAEKREVHLLDMRNHGKSFHSTEMSLDIMAEDIIRYMEYYALPQANVLGHSMGGKITMQMALSHPNRVSQLIIADIAPREYPPHHNEIFFAIKQIPEGNISSRQEVEQILHTYIKDKGIVQFLGKNLYRNEDNKLVWRFNTTAIFNFYQGFLESKLPEAQFDKPVLFLSGGNSSYILPSDETIILNYFPKAILKSIPNAGHWLHAEQPDAFLSLTEQFLSHALH